MFRFFSPARNISDERVTIADKNHICHIKDVLRLKAGDRVMVFDGMGNEYLCVIDKISDNIALKIKERSRDLKKERIKVTVACAIPKKSKMDDIIDHLTQLGVDRIIPMVTSRVIVKLDKQKEPGRLRRWEKIALNASEQSRRDSIAEVSPIRKMKEALEEPGDFDLKLIPTLSGERRPLKEVFTQLKPKNILILIGPEGDFTAQEVNLAIKSGCVPVSLGDLVLRVDTAAIAVAGFLRLYYEPRTF